MVSAWGLEPWTSVVSCLRFSSRR